MILLMGHLLEIVLLNMEGRIGNISIDGVDVVVVVNAPHFACPCE